MTNPPLPAVAPPLVIPLTDEVRAAYEDLEKKLQAALEDAANDPGAYPALAAARLQVDDILTKDTIYRLHEDTAEYQALLTQINSTNSDLGALKAQILAIDSKLATFGAVVGAIEKVATLVPCL